MYMFTRVATLRGNERRALSWATEMNAYVNAHSDHTMTLWRAQFGLPVGTVAWSTWADSHEDLGAGFAPLADDDGYFDLVDEGQEFIVEPPQDFLRNAIHGTPGDTPPPEGAASMVTTAVVSSGRYAEATTWGIQMAELVQELTGFPTMFLIDAYGTFGRVTWLNVAPDMAGADAGVDVVNADQDYVKRLADVGDLFVPLSGERRLLTRIA